MTAARRQTVALLVAIVVVMLLDTAVRWGAAPPPPPPILAGFTAARADRIQIGRVDHALVLERRSDVWWLMGPPEAPADPVAVAALLDDLAGGIQPEAVADAGHHERYGLSGGDERRIEVTAGDDVLMRLFVGHDAAGGGTWVRFPDSDRVLRADIGGRGRLDRPAGAWRDRASIP